MYLRQVHGQVQAVQAWLGEVWDGRECRARVLSEEYKVGERSRRRTWRSTSRGSAPGTRQDLRWPCRRPRSSSDASHIILISPLVCPVRLAISRGVLLLNTLLSSYVYSCCTTRAGATEAHAYRAEPTSQTPRHPGPWCSVAYTATTHPVISPILEPRARPTQTLGQVQGALSVRNSVGTRPRALSPANRTREREQEQNLHLADVFPIVRPILR